MTVISLSRNRRLFVRVVLSLLQGFSRQLCYDTTTYPFCQQFFSLFLQNFPRFFRTPLFGSLPCFFHTIPSGVPNMNFDDLLYSLYINNSRGENSPRLFSSLISPRTAPWRARDRPSRRSPSSDRGSRTATQTSCDCPTRSHRCPPAARPPTWDRCAGSRCCP